MKNFWWLLLVVLCVSMPHELLAQATAQGYIRPIAITALAPDGSFKFASISAGGALVDGNTSGNGNVNQGPQGYMEPVAPVAIDPTGNFQYLKLDTNGNLMVSTSGGGGGGSGATLPSFQTVFAGNGAGGAVSMPEEGVTVSGTVGTVAWREDLNAGVYDPRNTKYAGGIYGSNPSAAGQAMYNQMFCDLANGVVQQATAKWPQGDFQADGMILPPGSSTIGMGNSQGGTHLVSKNNSQFVFDAPPTETQTCSGTSKTITAGQTRVSQMLLQGCATGGCTNISGDTASYPEGGPNNIGLLLEAPGSEADYVYAEYFGGPGIRSDNADSKLFHDTGYSNSMWYYDGPYKGYAESLPSAEANVTTTGTTSKVTLNWTAVTGAAGYLVYRGTASGAEGTYYFTSTNSFVDTGAAGLSGGPLTSATQTSAATPGTVTPTGSTTGGTLAAAHYFYQVVSTLGIDGWHGSVEAYGADNMADWIEIYGLFDLPTVQNYHHIADFLGGGGDAHFDHIWAQLGPVGIAQPFSFGTGDQYENIRTDFTRLEGFWTNDLLVAIHGGIIDAACGASNAVAVSGTPYCVQLWDFQGSAPGGDISGILFEQNPGFGPNYTTADYLTNATMHTTNGSSQFVSSFGQMSGTLFSPADDSIHAVTGGAPSIFGFHNISDADTSPVTVAGYFASYNQEFYVLGGNANVTLHYDPSNLVLCSGQDVNLGNVQGWLHFRGTVNALFPGQGITAEEVCPDMPNVASSETVAFSGTPTFSAVTRHSIITSLTGNITTFTLPAGKDGQEKTLTFCQDGTGGRTVNPPSNVSNFSTISASASVCSAQHFSYSLAKSKWEADGLGSGVSLSGSGAPINNPTFTGVVTTPDIANGNGIALDARYYGVIADGTTDNGATINTMWSTVCANAALPRTIIWPAGTVKTTIPLVPPATCFKLTNKGGGSGGRTGSPTSSAGSTRISYTGNNGAAIALGTEATPNKAVITAASRTSNVVTIVTAYNAALAAQTNVNQIMVRNITTGSDMNTEDVFLASVATDGSTEVTLTYNQSGSNETGSGFSTAYVDLAHNDNSYYPSTNSAFGLEDISISCDSATRTNLLNFQSYTGQQQYGTTQDGMDAWRAPNLVLNHVNFNGCKQGFYGTNSDEDKFNDVRFTNNHVDKYIDTQSSQFEDNYPYSAGSDQAYIIDGAWGTIIKNGTFDTDGSTTSSTIKLQSTQQARATVGVKLINDWFENNHGLTTAATPSYISCGETGSGMVLAVDIDTPLFSTPVVPTASAPQTTNFMTLGNCDAVHIHNPVNVNHSASPIQPNPFLNFTGTYSSQDVLVETGSQTLVALSQNTGSGTPLVIWNQHAGGLNVLGGKHVQIDSQGTASAGTTGFNSNFFDICGSFYAASTSNRSCWNEFASVGPSFNNITVQPTTVGAPSVQWTWGQPVVSTSGANQSSWPMFWMYRVQHGSADVAGNLRLQIVPAGSGNDPAVEAQWTHSGSDTGFFDVNFPAVRSILYGSETVASSATPTFSLTTRASTTTLTANITSFTLAAGQAGQEKTLIFCENGTGGFTVTGPSNVQGLSLINTSASQCSGQHFTYSTVATAWIADGLGSGVVAGGGSMVYPAAGVPVSTGSAWGSSITLATGMATFLATPSSANLAATITDETGTGALVFGTAPTITLANGTGLPIAGISGLATGMATFLATPSSANFAAAITDETGTGALVLATSPTFVTPILGTPQSVSLVNATGMRLSGLANASATLTTGNANFGQIWQWTLTANGIGMSFAETAASTGGSALSQYILKASTLAGSTAIPFNVTNSLTGTQTLPTLYITPTWNTTGVVDAAILVNVTNTASGTGSLLEDLQIGGTSEFKVDKAGNVTLTGLLASANLKDTGLISAAAVATDSSGNLIAGTSFTNPMSVLGSIIYGSTAGAVAALVGPTAGTVPYNLCSTPSSGVATAPSWCLSGIGGRSVSGTTDTIAAADRGTTIQYTGSAATASAFTSPATLGNNFSVVAVNTGTGLVTFTLGAGNFLTVSGSSTTFALSSGQSVAFSSPDNTNILPRLMGTSPAYSGNLYTTTGLTAGNWYYMSATGLALAEGNVSSTAMPAICFAISTTQCQTNGLVTGLSGITQGGIYYISGSTAGAMTTTIPATTGMLDQRVAVGMSTTSININPSLDVATHP